VALTLRVTDAGGNPVSPKPKVSADRGKVVAVEPAGAGTWRVRWVAPDVDAPSRARLVASAGGVRAVADPVLLPPRPSASIAVSGGATRDLRGRSWGARGSVALELAALPERELPLGLELAWRAEVEGATIANDTGLALLAGVSASRALGPTLALRASASAGAWLTGGDAAPSGRLAVELGLERRGVAPFVETALLGATSGADGGFAAIMISAGIRLGASR
jgi:hypothetical protein